MIVSAQFDSYGGKGKRVLHLGDARNSITQGHEREDSCKNKDRTGQDRTGGLGGAKENKKNQIAGCTLLACSKKTFQNKEAADKDYRLTDERYRS